MSSSVRYQTFLRVYLLVITAFLMFCGIMNVLERDPWSVGDWLINYSGGFVRRGLLGQCIFLLSHLLHANEFVILLLFQWACYAVILWSIWSLLGGLAWPLWLILIVYSPATVSFTLLNPDAAYRKEILYFALLSVAILLPDRTRLSGVVGWIALPLGVFFLLMSHEGMAVFLPYLFAVFLIKLGSVRTGFLAFIPTALAAGVADILAALHQGNAITALHICSSIGGGENLAAGVCSGGIQYLRYDAAFARAEMPEWIQHWHLVYVAPYMIVLCLIPLFMGLAKLWSVRRFECICLAACALIAWLASVSLFMYARDWYRWIYIHAFCSMLVMLMIERRRQLSPGVTTVSWSLPMERNRRYAAIAFIVFMTFGWQCAFGHHFPMPLDRLQGYVKRKANFIRGHHPAEPAGTSVAQEHEQAGERRVSGAL